MQGFVLWPERWAEEVSKMAYVSNPKIQRTIPIVMLIALFVLSPVRAQSIDGRPVADAGLSRYAGQDPIVLDGTGSYDPDDSGPLIYAWQQISGPSVVISDANTATPTISGFVQTNEIQECEFELVVSNGELTSTVDTARVVIVPDFGEDRFVLQNSEFDPHKPTLVYFGGGDCIDGTVEYSFCPIASSKWLSRANVISYPGGYGPDAMFESMRTYYHLGDMIIVYLSSMAPDYKELIQTVGWSTGSQPAIDVGIRLNRVYQDARYAVNRVTHLDGGCRILGSRGGSWGKYAQVVESFASNSVDGEQCWIDHYWGVLGQGQIPKANILAIDLLGFSHSGVRDWYGSSLAVIDANRFNHGVVAGAYWSVIGPGKNLQFTKQSAMHYFRWNGTGTIGSMDFVNEQLYQGRLPEPVTLVLVGPIGIGDTNSVILTCSESENAIGYQLLLGPDPYRIMDYIVISDTPHPPNQVMADFPFEETFWTIKARDYYGSTIYADPIRINLDNLPPLTIDNLTNGRRYASIQLAIDDADSGDEIVISEGIYHEYIDFQGKNLIVRSTDPNDSSVVAATILTGDGNDNLVTFSNNEDASCVLAGFTITAANNGIYCSGASPRITSCNVVGNAGDGMKLYMGSNPTISTCIVAGNGDSGIAMLIYKSGRTILFNSPTIVNCTIVDNSEIGTSEGKPKVLNSIIYGNSVQIAGVSATVTYSDVQGGWPGEGNIDVGPLFADPGYWADVNDPNIAVESNDPNAVWIDGDYHLKSQAGRWDFINQSWIQDDVTSPCIDAGDPTSPVGLEPTPNGGRINMGAYGCTAEASKSS